MEKEDQFFLVTQRDSLAYAAAGTRKSPQFEAHYAKVGSKKILSRKANTSPSDDGTLIEPNQFYQYCVVDEKDRLVKPKKITKKGKNLRIDINDAHFVELLDFFGRDKHKEGVTKFVSHLNRETGNYEAINSVDGQLVELAPDHQDVAWCSRAGLIAAPEAAGHDIYVAEDLRYGQIYTLLPALPAPVAVAADEIAVAALPSLLPSFSPWVGGGAAAIALLSRGGGGAAAVPATPVPPVVADLLVHGHIMLGPLVAGTDLQVTAYDAAGNKLPSSTGNPITVTPNGTGGFDYAITITGGYRGVVTVRLSNSGSNLDYVSEFTATQVNLGTGALLGSDNVPTSENEWIINITQATDLAARRILSAASADTDAPQLAAGVQAADVTDANIAVTNALLPSSAGTRITQLLPKSTIGADGKSSGDTSDYALLLHTLDVVAQQAAASASPLTLQQVQTNISKLLTWPNDGFKTATLQTQLPLLDTTKTDAANNVWVPSLAANFEQNENIATSYLATVKPADIPTNPATGQPYKVSYDITGGTDQALFDIDPNTGQITWKAAPDYEAPKDQGADNTYQVIVTAVTNAPLTSAYLSSSQVVTIKVNNVAETTVPPVVVPVTPTPPVVPPTVDLVIQGEGMFGPIISGADLVVTAYKSDGTELGRTTVVGTNATQYGYKYNYTITVPGAGGVGGYSGVVTVRLTNGGVNSDYISEGTGLAQNLADSGALLATDVVVPNGNLVTTTVNLKIINITQATDLAARKVLKPDTIDDLTKNPVVGTGVQTTDVNNANIAVTDALVPEYAGKKKSITQLTPTSTITATGTPSGDTSDYALLLHTMDVIVQNTTGTTEKLKTFQQNLSGLLTWTGYTIADLPSKLPLVDTTPDTVDTSKWLESSVVILAPNEGASLAYDVSVKPSAIPSGATVSYAITGGGDANKFELVDADPVNPKVNQKLLRLKADQALPDFDNPTDYGTDNTYDVIVTATTNIGLTVGYLSSSQVVKFSIGNLADTPPVFLDNTTPCTKIADNTPLDVIVPSGTLAAYTPNVKFDAAADGKVYTLSGGVDASLFVIDASTGVVSFKDAANAPRVAVEWNADRTYTIEVTAEDTTVKNALGPPADPTRYQDTQTVKITVQKLLADATITEFDIANQTIGGTTATPTANAEADPSKFKFQDANFEIKFTVPVTLTTDATKKLHFVDETGATGVDVDLTTSQATLSVDGLTLTINPPSDLNASHDYHIEFDEGALLIGGQAVPALTGEDHGLDFTTQPPFTLHLAAGITDLEVTSQIVLTTNSDDIATAVAGKQIHFKNRADSGTKTGFHETTSADIADVFVIDAADTRYVNIVNGKVVINPPFDFDFANNYQITVDTGAFSTAANASGKVRSIVAPESDVNKTGALLFSTVNVYAYKATADLSTTPLSQTMLADGTVTTIGTKKWFAVDGTTADTTLNLSGGDYAMVFKDRNTSGQNPDVNDGVGAQEFNVTVNNFGSGDLVYADDQGNDKAQLNNSVSTQIIDEGVSGQLKLDFDPYTGSTGSRGTFTLNGEGGSLSIPNVIDRLNISNTRTLPTKVMGIQRVNSDGTDSSLSVLGPEITSAAPLKIKISAAFVEGDTVELVYINALGAITTLSTTYTAVAADKTKGFVTLGIGPSALSELPNHEGYNKIFAKVVNSSGAVSYSELLGSDHGVYVDTSAAFTAPTDPATTITLGAGQDGNLDTSAETAVDLAVQASELKVGDVLALKRTETPSSFTYTVTVGGTAHTGPYTYTDSDFGQNVVFTVNRADLVVGSNTFAIQRTDAAGNVASTGPKVITCTDFVTYTGTVGLGPVVDGNDLDVTAYSSAGVPLAVGKVQSNGTYSLDINKTYTGALTLRVANKTATNIDGTPDYWDEATHAKKDIGVGGSIAAVIAANGADQTVHITALTDLVARQLSVNNGVSDTITAAQIAAYNLKISQLFINSAATDGITSITPNFVIKASDGLSEIAANLAANQYGQLLAQISQQAALNSKTMDEVQILIKDAITWAWDSGNSTAAITLKNNDIAQHIVLLAKVAQAAALATGADASAYLSAADLTNFGLTDAAGLNADRKADLMARIVATADDGTALDTLTELQALAKKVVALAKIQDYAANGTNAPDLTDYTAAGVGGVNADNLSAVNAVLLGKDAAKNGVGGGTSRVPDDATITAAITTAKADALAAIQNYAKPNVNTNTNAPTLNDFILAMGDLGAHSGFAAACKVIRAYILDSTAGTNPAPTASTYADAGLSFIDTSDEVGSANYYLSKVMVNDQAKPSNVNDASLLTQLTQQHAALVKISAYADLATPDASQTPTDTDYQHAGITAANTTNLSNLNALVAPKAGGDVDTAGELATVVSSVFSGIPKVTSIARAGVGTTPTGGDAAHNTDSYLNHAELSEAGQTANFTVTFDRAVSGVTKDNFSLTDANGVAITGITAADITVTCANVSGTGAQWTVTVANLSGLSDGSSLRLNLVNDGKLANIQDSISGKAADAGFSAGAFYTVDQTNAVTLTDADDGDFKLTNTEDRIHLFVSADHLHLGDTLELTQGGTRVSGTSAVLVDAALLSKGGYTFEVLKSGNLTSTSNVLKVISTDAAGNTAEASVTVTLVEYIGIIGTVGLPSKVLPGHNLQVTAYDKDGGILGTGTIASDSTYRVEVPRGTSGLITLKITDGSDLTHTDYWSEAQLGNANLGGAGESISATLFIPSSSAPSSSDVPANISLLTDLASRIMAREYASGATSDQVTAVNTAVAKLLLKLTNDITQVTPDFAVNTDGSLTAGTLSAASLYGHLLTQLSQQAHDNWGGSLAVALGHMADGITWDVTSVATLNNDFAKQVLLLAKSQMAAALDNPMSSLASMDAVLSFQDLIDGGVTGLSALTTAARKAALIASIVNTANSGNDADTLVEIQALANKAIAMAKIQDYAALTAPATATASQTPNITDYINAGFATVTTDNLVAVNKAIVNQGVISDSLVPNLVNNGIQAHTTAIATLVAYTAGGASSTPPTLNDHLNAGVSSSVLNSNSTPQNLAAVNAAIHAAAAISPSATEAEKLAQIRILTYSGSLAYEAALLKIRHYIAGQTSDTPDAQTYTDAGLSAVDVASANLYLSDVMASGDANASDKAILDQLTAQKAALVALNDYAANPSSHVGGLTSAVYVAAGITSATTSNIGSLNAAVDAKTSITSLADLKAAIAPLHIEAYDLLSTAATNAGQTVFSDVPLAAADNIQTIQVAISGALDTAHDHITFGTVTQALNTTATDDGGTPITLNGISIHWGYSASKTLTFDKADGSPFTAAEAQSIEQSLSFTTSDLDPTIQGSRVFTLKHTDVDGNGVSPATSTLQQLDAFTSISNLDTHYPNALAVAAGMTLDMNTYLHSDIGVIQLGAGATAKVDLEDILQNTTDLFTTAWFDGFSHASNTHQMLIHGTDSTSRVVFDPASMGSDKWTKTVAQSSDHSHTYDVYENTTHHVQLLIEQFVQRNGLVL